MHRTFVLVIMLCLSACGSLNDYDITLNDRVLYTPTPLAVDPAISDPALAECIAQTLKDQKLAAAAQLQQLACTSAGVASLAGIGAYPMLRQLKLSDNRITDLTPLTTLSQLTHLWLDQNPLTDTDALLALNGLEQLSLLGIDTLDCASASALPVSQLTLPAGCQP